MQVLVCYRLMENDPTLTELDLHSKYITDTSLAGLADALMLNTVLTSLNLGQNYITSVGCGSLAKMIGKLPYNQHLPTRANN